jgi:CDP-ribitol ribitolphosphotransferase
MPRIDDLLNPKHIATVQATFANDHPELVSDGGGVVSTDKPAALAQPPASDEPAALAQPPASNEPAALAQPPASDEPAALAQPPGVEVSTGGADATGSTTEVKRIILFAPTFRGETSDTAFYPIDLLNLPALHAWCTTANASIVVSLHPYVTKNLTDAEGAYHSPVPPALADRIVDLSGQYNVNDLLHVADVLITDYSSVCYEFCYLGKPMLFFAPDESEYADSRGFLGNYRDLAPGKVVTSSEELLAALSSGDFEPHRADAYRAQFCGPADTHNADRVLAAVLGV